MFESEVSPDAPQSESMEGGLRPLEWAELVARFSAAHDLRRVLRPQPKGGSFTQGPARATAASEESKRAVNPDASTDIKARPSFSISHEENAHDGERDQE